MAAQWQNKIDLHVETKKIAKKKNKFPINVKKGILSIIISKSKQICPVFVGSETTYSQWFISIWSSCILFLNI